MKASTSIAKLLLLLVIGFSAFASEAQEDFRRRYKGRLIPGVWEESWTQTLNHSLDTSSITHHKEVQIENLCPGYGREVHKRQRFWQQLFLSLGWKESMHGPENWVEFRGGRNNGLYQINPELRSYYECHNYNLFDAHSNIRCAIKMAKRLVDRFGSFLEGAKGGMAAYWQPLRATSRYNRKNRAFILAFVKEACRTNTLYYHSRRQFVSGYLASLDDSPDQTFNSIDELGIDPSQLDPLQPFDYGFSPEF